MANTLNLNGDPRVESYLFLPVTSTTAVNFGDLCYIDDTTNAVLPASSFTYTSSDVITRRMFKQFFVGAYVGSHSADGISQTAKIACVATVDATMVSGTPSVGDLVGPNITANVIDLQKLIIVKDPLEAIGVVQSVYTGATTSVKVLLLGVQGGMGAMRFTTTETKVLPAFSLASATDIMAGIAVEKLLGGAAEILAMGFLSTTAFAGSDLVMNLARGTNSLGNLTVASATGGVAGAYTELDTSGSSYRVVAPNTTIKLTVGTAVATGAGNVVLRYRRLS